MPDIDEDVDVQINDDDLRIDTYRSSGGWRTAYQQDFISDKNYTPSYRNSCAVPE